MKEEYMKVALIEAKKAFEKGEIPIGCVIVKNNKIIAKTHNIKERKKCSLYHAELLAIKIASKKIKNWRLNECEMYITMEPCPMCSSAIKQSRIKKIYYGISNENNSISRKILQYNDINEKVEIESEILAEDCKQLVQKFFQNKRK